MGLPNLPTGIEPAISELQSVALPAWLREEIIVPSILHTIFNIYKQKQSIKKELGTVMEGWLCE